MTIYFSKEDIIYLHSITVVRFGGSDGIRDDGMLDSALNTPLQTFDGCDLYPTIIEKITRLSFGLIMDHPFFDGNKRISAKILDVGLSANNISLTATNEEMITEFIGLASGKITYHNFLTWVKQKSI